MSVGFSSCDFLRSFFENLISFWWTLVYLPQYLLFHLILHTVYTFRYFMPLYYGEQEHTHVLTIYPFVLYVYGTSLCIVQKYFVHTVANIFPFSPKNFPVNSTTHTHSTSYNIPKNVQYNYTDITHTHSHLSIRWNIKHNMNLSFRSFAWIYFPHFPTQV